MTAAAAPPDIMRPAPTGFWHWCPGCATVHLLQVEGTPVWHWDGDRSAPTFTPSFRRYRTVLVGGKMAPEVCHYFITKGEIAFLSDSTHALKGQTVPMQAFPATMPPSYTPAS